MSITYLATPYTSRDPATMQYRFEEVCKAAAKLMKAGERVFSPISHSHPIAQLGGLDQTSLGFWKKQDVAILRHASKVSVLMLPGWKESPGVAWETQTAVYLNIPVEYIEP